MQKNSWLCRVPVLTWLSVWMLVVPLFHVHPEADHLHGKPGHAHGGMVHTVLSDDLACEFGSHEKAASPGVALSEHFSQAGHDHPEFGFSLLTDATDRKSFKLLGTQAAVVAISVMSVLQGCNSAAEDLAPNPSSTFFAHDLPSRAPPVLVA